MANILTHSIFGDYQGVENRVTAAFLHVLNIGGEPLLRYVLSAVNELLPANEISICTQLGKTAGIKKMVFDGLISCDFSFSYIIESKVKANALTSQQVNTYRLKNPNSILIALTPDATVPSSLNPGDIWLNWTKLADVLISYEDENQDDLLKYLIEQFILLLNNLNLYDDWQNRVIVVGGSWGEPVALKYNFYACQNNRYFKQAKYLAFAYRNKIEHLFEIQGTPQNDIDLSQQQSIPQSYFRQYEPLYKKSPNFLSMVQKCHSHI